MGLLCVGAQMGLTRCVVSTKTFGWRSIDASLGRE